MIIVVIYTTKAASDSYFILINLLAVKIMPKKNSGLDGIQTYDHLRVYYELTNVTCFRYFAEVGYLGR